MATIYDEKQKSKIYKWREDNQEEYKAIQKKASKKYRDTKNGRAKMNEAKKRYRERHKEEIAAKRREKKLEKELLKKD